MRKVTHVDDFIRSLPKIARKKIWEVTDSEGKLVQYCSASDNLKRTAQKYIDGKYPGQTMKLKFHCFHGLISLP